MVLNDDKVIFINYDRNLKLKSQTLFSRINVLDSNKILLLLVRIEILSLNHKHYLLR